MMKLEDQVCSIEHGKRLAELGVKRESYFVIRNATGEIFPVCAMTGLEDMSDGLYFPAYTVGELGEMLPWCIVEYDRGLTIRKYGDKFEVCYPKYAGFLNDNIANAYAIMLIWLIDNKHITVEEINSVP